MQTVPSLVGTGTAIAAAASGLVFGHPNDSDTSTGRRVLHKRNASFEPSPTRHDRLSSPSLSRPGTSYRDQAMATANDLNHSTLPRPASRSRPPLSRYQRPQSSQFPSRQSSIKNSTPVNELDVVSNQPVDSRRNSLSSTGSWMRRLSLRPLSQHGSSPRSSIVAERQSVALSHSSTVPMLRPNTAAPNLAPNKLVKRSPSIPNHDPQQVSRSKSKGHLPTLRRPATSHQRTATLQQLRLNAHETQGSPRTDAPKYSFENHPSTESIQTASYVTRSSVLVENISWSSFFHSRRTAVDADGRPSTGSPHSRANTVRRISAKAAMAYQNSVHLVKPRMVTSTSLPTLQYSPSTRLADPAEIVPEKQEEGEEQKQQEQHAALQEKQIGSAESKYDPDNAGEMASPSMRIRRSLSASFATVAANLSARTSGSLRRSKRGQHTSSSEIASGERRHASAPISGSSGVLTDVGHGTKGLEPPMASLKRGPLAPQVPLTASASSSAASDAPHRHQLLQHRPDHQPQHAQQQQQPTRQYPQHHKQHPRQHISSASPLLMATQPTATNNTNSSLQVFQTRNLSSPLPPPPQRALIFQNNFSSPRSPRSASFAPALGPAGGAPVVAAGSVVNSVRPLQPSTSSTASSAMSMSHHRASYYETSPPMEGSESEGRGFISGDEDDTDFKSDTLYDSLRTVASSRTRALDTPLESVYDDSPSSTASNGKSRRLSIHEMLGKAWDGGDRITEEDEALQTPVRLQSTTKAKSPASHDANSSPSADQLRLVINPIHSTVPSRDFGRMSLEDDFDDDWARYEDDEADSHISPLSAPSKSSLNAKGMNPNVRLALANMGNGTSDENTPTMDRPLSNIFDWSEPSTQDKHDSDRRSGRPQTAYGKQTLDPRSGRSANRRGPAPAHVRSQSVPVVHDAADEQQKATGAKYGTWGLGTKTVSEDWDEDFEFGSSAGNGDRGSESMFAVPESIRASQPSVKAHSGQIRELSLLVNDLKRLCRHARDMGLLEGSQKALWKEAEGVIALASPDDETMEDDVDSNPSVDLDAFDSKAKQGDQRPKTPQTEKLDFGSPKLEPSISKTAVVRERHSPRRRSVFSPDDDIFGGADSSADKKASTLYRKTTQHLPRTPERIADVNGVVRTVMEAMQHHNYSDTVQDTGKPSRKVQFDTNSLKALVRRSGELRDALSDIIRRTDQLTQSPARPLRHDRDRGPDSSPAFTRVFDDPGSSPPRRTTRSRGNNSLKKTTSPDSSPPPQLERRFPLMTVR